MATVGICHLLRQSVAVIAIALFIDLPLTETITNNPQIQIAIPDISVNRMPDTGDTELVSTLNVETIKKIEHTTKLAVTEIPSEPEPEEKDIYDIPDYPGRKSYMSYTSFKAGSRQAQLQQQAVTDANGLRVINGRYCIAIGTRFGTVVGQNVDLILSNGTIIPCIVGDLKAEKDTDVTNTFSPNGCCSEFIVDKDALESVSKRLGDVSNISEAWQSPVSQIKVWR